MKKVTSPYFFVLATFLVIGLVAALGFTLSFGAAEAAPQAAFPKPPPRPTPFPTAQLKMRETDQAISPARLSSGIPITYTFKIYNERGSKLDARDAYFELPFSGDQQFLG